MRGASTGDLLTSGQCATVLKALASGTRLRIVGSLLVDDKCVSALAQELKYSQPRVSHHLRILRDAGLVKGQRGGKQVYYRVVSAIQRALAHGRGQALSFGCCELRFPKIVLAAVSHTH